MMIDRIASYLEQEMDIRRMMRASTMYPKLLVVAALTIPNLPTLVMGSPQAYLLLELGILLSVLRWAIPAYVIFRLMLQFDAFRAFYDTLKVSIPVMGGLIRKLSMARFSRALALLYSAGMPMAQAVQIAADAVGNYLVRRAVLKAVPQIANGVPASEAIRRTGQVPPMVLDMLSTGEKTGNVDLTLNKVAEYYEKESESTVRSFGVIIFVVLVLAVAIMIMLQVVHFYSGYFGNLYGQGQ
jgi:type II secretory pathway component PulF